MSPAPSYPLSSPALSPTERLPFGLEENGGTPFAPKASGRLHHQLQHHSNYGLSLTLEKKEGPLRSPNSSKALTSECVEGSRVGWGGLVGDRNGWCCHGYRVWAAWTIEPDAWRQSHLERSVSCLHLVLDSSLLSSLDSCLCSAQPWPRLALAAEKRKGGKRLGFLLS